MDETFYSVHRCVHSDKVFMPEISIRVGFIFLFCSNRETTSIKCYETKQYSMIIPGMYVHCAYYTRNISLLYRIQLISRIFFLPKKLCIFIS